MQKLKQFFKDFEEMKATVSLIFEKQKETTDIKDVTLMRHLFGSIDLSDVPPIEKMKDQERKDFAASIAIIFPKLQRIIKPIIEEQKDAGYTLEGNTAFVKGTMNGIYLVLEALEQWKYEHIENTKPKEDFDPHTPIPELLERVSRASGLPSQTPGERSA